MPILLFQSYYLTESKKGMRKYINIKGNDQLFKYLVEFTRGSAYTDGQDIGWCVVGKDICLFEGDVTHYRVKNDWYSASLLTMTNTNIPNKCRTSRLRVYIPQHSVDTYVRGVQYMLTASTWINGVKIDLGSTLFRRTDTLANDFGVVKNGNDEYFENFDIDIIDPHDIMYSDSWMNFRNKVCGEPKDINNTGSILNVTLYVVEQYEDSFIMKKDWVGSFNTFNISDLQDDYLKLNIAPNYSVPGFDYTISMNPEYNWLSTYLGETYGLDGIPFSSMKFELIARNKTTAVVGPIVGFDAKQDYGVVKQTIKWESVLNGTNERHGLADWFDSWENYEEGWFFVGSYTIYDGDDEMFTILSNELPITQELFSFFVGDATEKIIDVNDMEIINYNVVNKIENRIVQLDRPDNSKSNIIQPVFFKVKDTEHLTLHPAVTENICVNLDDYKSKVDKFYIQIGDNKFEQIGANQYGILFKFRANVLSEDFVEGTYYVLNQDYELVTMGKYKCIR